MRICIICEWLSVDGRVDEGRTLQDTGLSGASPISKKIPAARQRRPILRITAGPVTKPLCGFYQPGR